MKKINTRQILLEVSEKIFAESGFEGASTRRITLEAGVNISTINYYYGSKELLYSAIFMYRLSEMNSTLSDRLRDKESGVVKKLNRFIDEYFSLLKSNLHFLKLMRRELCEVQKSSVKALIVTEITKNSKILYKLIDQGIRQNVFRPVNLPMIVLTTFTLLFQIVAESPIAESMLQYDKFDIEWNTRISDLKEFLFSILKANLAK